MVKKVWQTDGQTDRQTDRLNQSYSCLVAAKNSRLRMANPAAWSDHTFWRHQMEPFSATVPLWGESTGTDLWCFFVVSLNKLLTHWGRQNDRHFPGNIFKCNLLNENVWISIKISLKFVPKGSISNIPALVQIMAWCQLGDKPLSEPMLACSPTHICVSRPQWVKQTLAWLVIQDTMTVFWHHYNDKQRVLMHRHQGLNVRHGLCHIYMRYLYIYELFIAFVCFVVCSLL